MAKGFMYLTVIMDWHSRGVLAWRISNTLEPEFCVEALEEALSRYGDPKIFNTDQGAQNTSEAFTAVLKAHGVMFSMDGKGLWADNVFFERLWRCVKYEDVYLRAYESPAALRVGLRHNFQFYNTQRRHQALNRQTPDAVYFTDPQIENRAESLAEFSLIELSKYRGPLLISAIPTNSSLAAMFRLISFKISFRSQYLCA